MKKKKRVLTRPRKRWHILTGVALSIIAILNIISSQTISPFYFPLIRNDKVAVIASLQKLISQPQYKYIVNEQESRFNEKLEDKVIAKPVVNATQIDELEYGLKLNPKSPQVLYRLYELYKNENQTKKAEEYLKRAQEVDPNLH